MYLNHKMCLHLYVYVWSNFFLANLLSYNIVGKVIWIIWKCECKMFSSWDLNIINVTRIIFQTRFL